ncbi:hypothetical protein TWF730_006441 [Orbilia blumenaviensis]|uniref:Uncharacterized protein n=1 Tax=Orbilia blumenaviensis TaxID=1796055 RepID=A0AAV9VES9_9PEZI
MSTTTEKSTPKLRYDVNFKENVAQIEWPEELNEFKQSFNEHAAIVEAAWKAAEEETSDEAELALKFKASIAEHEAAHTEVQKKLRAQIDNYPKLNEALSKITAQPDWGLRVYNNLSVYLGDLSKYTEYGHFEFSPDDDIAPGNHTFFYVGEDLLGRCNQDIHYTVKNDWQNRPDIHLKWVFDHHTTEEFRADVLPGYAQPYYAVKVDWGSSFTVYHK